MKNYLDVGNITLFFIPSATKKPNYSGTIQEQKSFGVFGTSKRFVFLEVYEKYTEKENYCYINETECHNQLECIV